VLGGQNPQHAIVTGGGPMPTNSQGVPWNAGYIVASGNLLADFRSNVAAEDLLHLLGEDRVRAVRGGVVLELLGVEEHLTLLSSG